MKIRAWLSTLSELNPGVGFLNCVSFKASISVAGRIHCDGALRRLHVIFRF